MPYSNFTSDDLETKFSIINKIEPLLPATPLSNWLETTFLNFKDLPSRTEKSKSETIILPVLIEIRNNSQKYATIYPGQNLNADQTKGLNGKCDFILAKDTQSFNLNQPILKIVEAKNHDINIRTPQCAAQLLGQKSLMKKNTHPQIPFMAA